MLNRAGILTLLITLTGGASALLWGLPAVFVASAVVGALLILSLISVNLPLRVGAERLLTPARAAFGTRILVTLRFYGFRRLFGRSVRLQEFSATEEPAVRDLGMLPSGRKARLTYYVEPSRRGIVEMGPLRLTANDPFDLARRSQISDGGAGEVSRALIWPYFEEIWLPMSVSELAGASRNRLTKHLPASEEEFAGLREYAVGDDPRRIHWPSSARHGELMVRQVEHDFLEEAVIYLDTDWRAASEQVFEEMVSAAAGLVATCCKLFHNIRLMTPTGSASVVRSGVEGAYAAPLLDKLSLVAQTDFASSARVVRPSSDGTTLFAVLGKLPETTRQPWGMALGGARRRYLVQFCNPHDAMSGADVILVQPGESFPERWHAALGDLKA